MEDHKVVVKVGDKEFPYEFKEMWELRWFIRILNFSVKVLKLFGYL